jgi:hypothetical protein
MAATEMVATAAMETVVMVAVRAATEKFAHPYPRPQTHAFPRVGRL